MTSMTIDLLLSYAFHKDRDLNVIRAAIGNDGLLLVDSGAFTAHRTGMNISLDAYADYLERWRGVYDAAMTLDVIGDAKATWANTRKLWDRGYDVIPVHTGRASLADFDAMCAETDYIALGGLVGIPSNDKKRAYIAGLVERARRRGVATHVLGMSSGGSVRAAAPWSCDVSTASRSLTFGSVVLYTEGRVTAVQMNDFPTLRRYRQELSDHGLSIKAIIEDPLSHDNTLKRITAGLAAMTAFGYDLRKRVVAEPPKRLAGRTPGPRICSALTTQETVEMAVAFANDGQFAAPVPRVVARRLEQP